MFGQPQFAATNSLINTKLSQHGVLVVAHRGTGGGSVAVNTMLGVRAAMLHGADMIELDVTASVDGVYYCFQDGCEPELLGLPANLQGLTAAEIDQASYVWLDRPGRPSRVDRLLPLLATYAGTEALFKLDRSWWRWPQLLQELAGLGMAGQLVLKCPAWEESALQHLREFDVKFPLVPICASPADAYHTVNDPELNTVGLELITTTRRHPWFSPSVIEEFHQLGTFCLVNTVTLPTGVPLFGGLDDELAIANDPVQAYEPLFELGVDAIQTDWPALLRDFRANWPALASPALRQPEPAGVRHLPSRRLAPETGPARVIA